MTRTTKATLLVIALGATGSVVAVLATRQEAASAGSPGIRAQGAGSNAQGNCQPTHCVSTACETCTAQNCLVTDSCDGLDAAGQKLCEDIYQCLNDPKNACVTQGDSLKCWCGTNPTTCVTSNSPPTRANGPCLDKVFAGAVSEDAPTIRQRFVSAAYPLGRAVLLTQCRGTFCKAECGVP